MIELDTELARGVLVVGLVISALTYHFLRVNSGGVVTVPFLAIMVLSYDWVNILGWLVLATFGYLTIRYLAERWPLPREWLFLSGVFVPMVFHVVGINLSLLPPFESFSTFLAAGLYVTCGLTAYDSARQGLLRTLISAAAVTAVTIVVVLLMVGTGQFFGAASPQLRPFVEHDPLLAFVVVCAAIVARLAFGLGTVGIIGGAYLIQIGTPTVIITVTVLTLIGAAIYKWAANFLGLSPKQAFYSLLAVGSITAWFALFWADYFGLPGAEVVNLYVLEPLLVVGLMIGETARFGPVRMLLGAILVATSGIALTSAVSMGILLPWVAYLLVVVLFALGIRHGLRKVHRGWEAAVAAGQRWGTT